MRLIYLFAILPLITSSLFSEEIDVSKPLRIEQFFPKKTWADRPSIDPALPESFISFQIPDSSPPVLLWGPSDSIHSFLEGEELSSPLILCMLEYLSLDAIDEKQLQKTFGPTTTVQPGNWGEIRYWRFSFDVEGYRSRSSFISLNEAEKTVLSLSLIALPGQESAAEEIWNTFFEKTTPLPFPLMVKSKGQEMHPGYTLLDVGEHQIKAIAQKRNRDQTIRYALIPQDEATRCTVETAFTTAMGNEWHHGEPLLKLVGCYSTDNYFLFKTISVLIEEVDEFTLPTPSHQNNELFGEFIDQTSWADSRRA